MKFEDAEKSLAELAGDRYYSITYTRTRFSKDAGGDHEQECRLYIAPKSADTEPTRVEAPTWAEALAKLTAELNGTPYPTTFHDEAPEELTQETP
jgi:hypothetical protein